MSAMPLGGLISWSSLALAGVWMGDKLPLFSVFMAAAIPFPLALLIDKLRGQVGLRVANRHNPITQLFMRFITVTGVLVPFAIIAARTAHDPAILFLGITIFSGIVWVPHGWGANDPAGFRHFLLRSVLAYLAYLLARAAVRDAAIAGAAALSYLYAIAAMRRPYDANTRAEL